MRFGYQLSDLSLTAPSVRSTRFAVSLLAGFAAIVLNGQAAYADCLPSAPVNGDVVICASPGNVGLVSSANFLTVIVQPGATVIDDGVSVAISVAGVNTVINNGTIAVAPGMTAIETGDRNLIVNNNIINIGDGGTRNRDRRPQHR